MHDHKFDSCTDVCKLALLVLIDRHTGWCALTCLCCALIASWLMDYGSRDAIWVTKEIQHGIEEEQQAINLKKDKCLLLISSARRSCSTDAAVRLKLGYWKNQT